MTVSTDDTFVVYQGNGSATNFPYTFRIPDPIFARISLRDADTHEVTEVLDPSDYTITGTTWANYSGGVVTYNPGTPLSADYEIVIERNVDFTQGLDLQNQGGFFPESIEQALDLAAMQTQQLQKLTERALLVQLGEEGLTFSQPIEDFEQKAIGVQEGQLVPITANSFEITEEMEDLAEQVEDDAAQVAADRIAVAADLVLTHADVVLTHADAASADSDATAAAGSALSAATSLSSVIAAIAAGSMEFYGDVAAGLAGTGDGDYFVVADPVNGTAKVYLNSSGSAVLQVTLSDSTLAIYLLVLLGADISTITVETIGSTAGDGATYNTASGLAWGNAAAASAPGIITQVSIRTAGTTIVDLDFVAPRSDGNNIVKTISNVSLPDDTANVVQTVDIGLNYVELGTRMFEYFISGDGFRYAGSGGASYSYNTADRASNPVTFSSLSTFNFAISYTIVQTTDASVNARLASLETRGTVLAGVAAALGANFETEEVERGPTETAVVFAGSNDWCSPDPLIAAGDVDKVTVNIQTSGQPIEFWLERPVRMGSLDSYPITEPVRDTSVSGEHEYILSQPLVGGLPGDFIACRSVFGAPGYVNTAPVPPRTTRYFPSNPSNTLGTVRTALVLNSSVVCITYKQKVALDPKKVPAAASSQGTRGPSLIHRQTFVSSGDMTDENWIVSGAWTASNGLSFSGAGSYSTQAVLNSYTHINESITIARGVFGSGYQGGVIFQPQTSFSVGGTRIRIDDVTHKLGVYSQGGTLSAGTLISDVTIPSLIGHILELRCEKVGRDAVFTLYDTTNPTSGALGTVSVPWAASLTTQAGLFGRMGVWHLAGDVTWESFEVYANNPFFNRVLFIGDSRFTTADLTLTMNTAVNQVRVARAAMNLHDCMVVAQPGLTIAQTIEGLSTDLDRFFGDDIIIQQGTNGGPTDIAQNYMRLLDMCRPRCHRLWAMTIPIANPSPWATQNIGFKAHNTDLRNGVYGSDVRVLDAAKWLSVGNDGDTYNSTYIAADGLHENQLGQNVEYIGLTLQLPQLLR